MKNYYLFKPVFVFLIILTSSSNSWSQNCQQATSQIDLDANNVSARLLTGGDFWWDGEDGRYIVPKQDPGLPEVAAIFAGGLWLGGFDLGGNLKTAVKTYGLANGSTDYWPGPLDDVGNTTEDNCANWDRFFQVTSADINAHLADYNDNGMIDDPVPNSILGWPGRGNAHFFDVNFFELPEASIPNHLAPFIDLNWNGIYEPMLGDYPDIKGADQGIWWVFNDAGGIHTESLGDRLKFEVSVLAYSYNSTEEHINNATFYDLRFINRAIESIDSLYVGLWVDFDLGCYADDMVGCDSMNNLAYVYNADAVDGISSCSDCSGVNTYCEDIPLVGIKMLDGILAPDGGNYESKGMTNFIAYDNGGTIPGPNNALDFYRLLSGSWPDGTRLTKGGNGYNPGSTDYTNYLYPSAPDDPNGWSMCTENLPGNDRRIVMSSGPTRMDPSQSNRMSFAVIYVDDISHPCPSIEPLIEAGDEVQELFDEMLTSTEELAKAPADIVFQPNPMQDQAHLLFNEIGGEVDQVSIFSIDGKMMQSYQHDQSDQMTIERGDLSAGIYFYKIRTKDYKIYSGKFIVQ